MLTQKKVIVNYYIKEKRVNDPICRKIKIPPQSGGYFSFGQSPNTTGYAQVRRLLACQPRMGLLATRKRVSGIVKTDLVTFPICL